MLFLPLFCAVLLVPKQASAEGYSCSASVPVEVEVSGEKIPEGMEYQIVLEAVTKDAPMPEKTVLTVRNEGKAEFGPIAYTVPEDYQYKVYQLDGKADRFTYDKTAYTVTVRVVNDENGGLRTEVWAVPEGSGGKTDSIRFDNCYQAPDPPKTHHHSNDSGSTSWPLTGLTAPQTGDSANLILWISAAAASLAAVVVLLRKRIRISK